MQERIYPTRRTLVPSGSSRSKHSTTTSPSPIFPWSRQHSVLDMESQRISTPAQSAPSVPIAWKTPDLQEGRLSNWRPISLQPNIYKMYVAIVARRLASWTITNKKLSPPQKGFLPFDGYAEHSFLLWSIFEDSKWRNRTVRVVWLDLKNGFGSVPHSSMWGMMSRLGVPQHFIDICEEIYRGSTQVVKSSTGPTAPLPVTQGIIKQPLLFNLILEGILPTLECHAGGTSAVEEPE